MFEDLETQGARRAVWFTLGGAMLMVSCYWGFRYFVHIAAYAVDVGTPTSRDAVGHAGAPLALGLTAGMVLFYMGTVRLLVGPKIDAIDIRRLTAPGLLYALGFAGCVGLVAWLVVGFFKIDLFG
ncbi:hypothetical protein DB30_01927 [Enhygromyxa salina]|uniref:Uncharacterized protein n=1 Tax=Enhygromyxa salina TaxID=215803 RepID=A0A0C2D8U8_9BACT|nr:hypothetical protein [Enhygromyxa salina]KIG18040.1 hypothetical protein DB30_01927 [Enhygromyxa salina]